MAEKNIKGSWQPVRIIPPTIIEELHSFIDLIRDIINTATATIKTGLTVAKIILDALQKKVNALNQLVKELEELINSFLDSLLASGVYSMYISPTHGAKQGDVLRTYRNIQEFLSIVKGAFPEEKYLDSRNYSKFSLKDAKNFEDILRSPRFKKEDCVGGMAFVAIAPDPSEVVNSFYSILRLFSIPVVPDGLFEFPFYIRLNLIQDYELVNEQSFIDQGIDILKGNSMSITWTTISFPHTVLIQWERVSLYTTEEKLPDITLSNLGSDPSIYRDSYLFTKSNGFEEGYAYKITVTIYDAKKKRRGPPATKTFEIPRSDLLLAGFRGNVGSGKWFGASLDSLFPFLYILKRNLQEAVSTLANNFRTYVNSFSRLIDMVLKRIDYWLKVLSETEQLVNDFLDRIKAVIDVQMYVKFIEYKRGGNDRYIKEITDTTGINKIYTRHLTFQDPLKGNAWSLYKDVTPEEKAIFDQGNLYAAGIFFLVGNICSVKERASKFLNVCKSFANVDVESYKQNFESSLESIKGQKDHYENQYTLDTIDTPNGFGIQPILKDRVFHWYCHALPTAFEFPGAPSANNDSSDTMGIGTVFVRIQPDVEGEGPVEYDSPSGITFVEGSTWYDTENRDYYVCVDATPGNAIWKKEFSETIQVADGVRTITRTYSNKDILKYKEDEAGNFVNNSYSWESKSVCGGTLVRNKGWFIDAFLDDVRIGLF